MLHTFFKVALLGALTASLSLADDFLARATNGALSDNSVGVKKLTADEASKVVGGYNVAVIQVGYREMAAVVVPTIEHELAVGAMCDIGKHSCYIPGSDKVYNKLIPYTTNTRKFDELMLATNNDPLNKFVAYSVTKNVTYTKLRPLISYTTRAILVGVNNNKIYKIGNISSGYLTREVGWAYEQILKNNLAFQ